MMPQVGIRTRFTLILSLIFVVTIVAAWIIFSRVVQQQAEDEITYQASVLIAMLNSVRTYTNTEVNPLLAPQNQQGSQFIAQSVPAFSAREVFENFRKNELYQNFLYKEATLNPTNLRDLADDSEAGLLKTFQNNPGLQELSGFTTLDGQQVFYIAHPLKITSQNCLSCHSDPKSAPASLIATYGSEHGFGWHLNDIISAQTIYIPAADIFATAQRSLTLVMGILIVIFAIVIIVTDAGLRRAVVHPVVQIARLAQLIGGGSLTPEAPELHRVNKIAGRSDELGHTAKVIQRMAKEIYEREQKLKMQIESLRIQIDTDKQTKEVKEITESDYFQNLQKQAHNIRQRSDLRKATGEMKPVDGENES